MAYLVLLTTFGPCDCFRVQAFFHLLALLDPDLGRKIPHVKILLVGGVGEFLSGGGGGGGLLTHPTWRKENHLQDCLGRGFFVSSQEGRFHIFELV